MTSRPTWSLAACLSGALLLLASLSGCPAPVQECLDGTEDVCDGGHPPPDYCNSPAEALADSTNCQLTVNDATGTTRKEDVYISRLEDGGVDRDWYLAVMPATITARSLLHINAGYSVAQTAVNFSVNVLQQQSDGGLSSIATGIDTHGTAAPKPVDIIIPFSTPGANVFLNVGDQSSGLTAHVDNVSPYSVLVQVLDNPDTNEPNDTVATPVTLAASGGTQTGTSTGYLATPNDLDLYSFPVVGSSRQIVYLHITGPTPFPTNPPPPYRLSYTLLSPAGTPIAEGHMDNQFLSIDLATAVLAPAAGTYTVKVTGYRDSSTTGDIGGDLRVKYTVKVIVMPDLDTNEPNDSLANASAINLSPNSSATRVGQLSTITDEEWFVVNLPANAMPSTLRYQLTAAAAGGRFDAPLSSVPSRQLRFFTQVNTSGTPQDRQVACTNDPVACPKGYTETTSSQGSAQADLVASICKTNDPPLCLWAERDEEVAFTKLKNLVGALPVAANKATKLYFMFRDQGRGAVKYADDRDWTLQVSWVDDADEAAKAGGPTQITLGTTTAPAPGVLSYGYGDILTNTFDINSGEGIRGPEDYDAYPSDKDLFQFNLSATGDQNWEISWELNNTDAGTPPGDVGLEMTFCGSGAAGDGGLCAGEKRFIFGDTQQPVAPWYSSSFDLAHSTLLFSRANTGATTVITARPVGCWCVNSARVAAGKFFANVSAFDRVTNDPITYTVRQRLTAYPGSYVADGGATVMCPVVDGGCGFAP